MKKIRVHSLLKCLPLAVAMVTLLPGFVHAHSPEGTTLNTKSPEVTTPETRNSGATGFNTGNTELSSPNPRLEVPAEAVERLRAIFERGEFGARTFSGVWIPGGSGYAVLETLPGDGGQALAAYEAESGRRTEWVTAARLASMAADGPVHIQHFSFSPDGSHVLLAARNRNNDGTHHWLLERTSGRLQKVTAGANASIAPDGRHILFYDGGNLKIYNVQHEQVVQLTHDAVPGSIANYSGYWSPDGSRIAFVQSDNSRIRMRKTLHSVDPTFPELRETRFARVGETIPTLRVGVTDTEGKEIRWLQIPHPTEGYYLGNIGWAGNSSEVFVEKLSRFRDRREVLLADVGNGTITTIFEESDPAWVVGSYHTNLGVVWIDQYGRFLILSEQDGWRHAWSVSRDGNDQVNITPGAFDIIQRVGVDHEAGWFYFNASPDDGTRSYLYRVRLDGSVGMEMVTPAGQPGTHTYVPSPDGKFAFHTFSSDVNPPITQLVSLDNHRALRVLEENGQLREKLASVRRQPKEFFQLDIGDGVVMDSWMIKPVDFDPSRKYPVFVYVYGEPHLQTVIDAWGHAMADYHRVIADLGYLVVSIDNRGTPAPKGAAWRRSVFPSLGPLSTVEQAAGIRELGRTRPYVDLDRVGIWGWSGGGSNTLNAMFRKPDVYHTGIAVVPKPQAHLYNAWFQEIYMNTPEVNPEGYRESSAINFADGLEGNLLIVHGTGETNTHLEIVEGLVDRLIELEKQFDYFPYPNRDHGLAEGIGTPLHVRVYMGRYLLNHLPPGPR
jgi:dipeptidyl-peptidase 4